MVMVVVSWLMRESQGCLLLKLCTSLAFLFLIDNTISYADDDHHNARNRQLLINSIQKGNLEEGYKLINSGIDLNVPGLGTSFLHFLSNPMTPLETAILWGNKDFVGMLLENGADPNFIHDGYGRLPVTLAMRHNYFDIAQMLLDAQTDLDIPDRYGDTPLTWAAGNAHPRFVEMLLAYGAMIDAQNNENGQTTLVQAVRGNHIVYGADPNAQNNGNGQTSAEIINMLLKQGADPNIPDVDGETALMVVSRSDRNHSGLVKTLIEAGADPYKRDKYDRTALMIAENRQSKTMSNGFSLLFAPISAIFSSGSHFGTISVLRSYTYEEQKRQDKGQEQQECIEAVL